MDVDGTLSIMFGDPEEAFDKVKSILENMGSSAIIMGDVGNSNTTKMEIMQALEVNGKAEDDHGGTIRFYEKLVQAM
jgi:3-hydroxyisobutyrate dehydrogenase-like beta-hydroxyacid dehydrogenase